MSEPIQPARPIVRCVIPCYNLAGVCGEVFRESLQYADSVLAVDDGSTDGTEQVLRSVARASGPRASVLRLPVNRGKGFALLRGFREVARTDPPFDVLVTLDGDRQHRPSDVPRLARACFERNAALVIGERDELGRVPLRSRLGNSITRSLVHRSYPDAPRDTQSGFRAMDRGFVEDVLECIRGSRYETELNVLLLALSLKRRILTVPIPALYLDGNRSSHFSPVADSTRIVWAFFSWQLAGRRSVSAHRAPRAAGGAPSEIGPR